MKKFDLNIEEVLEDWEVYHALREIISNALDEQILSKTKDMEITKDGDRIKIRDFGRGLKYEHLTQKENQEKLNNPELVIGKFGVGFYSGFMVAKKIEVLLSHSNPRKYTKNYDYNMILLKLVIYYNLFEKLNYQ